MISYHVLGAVHMSRAGPTNRADSILSPLMGRGGSRGRQISHATNVKIANLINALKI